MCALNILLLFMAIKKPLISERLLRFYWECLFYEKSTLPLRGQPCKPSKSPTASQSGIFCFSFSYEYKYSTLNKNKKSDEYSSDFEFLRSGRDSNPRPRA